MMGFALGSAQSADPRTLYPSYNYQVIAFMESVVSVGRPHAADIAASRAGECIAVR
jgi:hypothetical protein